MKFYVVQSDQGVIGAELSRRKAISVALKAYKTRDNARWSNCVVNRINITMKPREALLCLLREQGDYADEIVQVWPRVKP